MLTAERLREVLHYDPDTGEFTRLQTLSRRAPAGTRAGCMQPEGYRQIRIDGVAYRAHRLAVLYMEGTWPARDVDHENLDKGDNRWVNLRRATRSQNSANTTLSRRNKSGYKGVCWSARDQKWRAHIRVGKKGRSLGYFDDPVKAYAAYCEAAQQHFGEFARVA